MKIVKIILVGGLICFCLLLAVPFYLNFRPYPLPTEAEINTIVDPPLKEVVGEMIQVLDTCQKPQKSTQEINEAKYRLLFVTAIGVHLEYLRHTEDEPKNSLEVRPVIQALYEATLFKLRWVNQQEITTGWAKDVHEQVSEYLERLKSESPNPRTKPAFDWLNPEYQPSPPSREGSFLSTTNYESYEYTNRH